MTQVPRSVAVRSQVVVSAVGLFQEHGFEATSVEDIARAAGVSRSTYFRQFGGKEDAVFADHGPLMEEIGAWMAERSAARGSHPWGTVCEASQRVFAHLSEDPGLARRRYEVVRAVPALRDREIVTERRYEQLFARFLRDTVSGLEPVDAIGFAALVTATHNHFLRQAVRTEGREGDGGASGAAHDVVTRYATELEQALVTVRRRFGVEDQGSEGTAGGSGASSAAGAGAVETTGRGSTHGTGREAGSRVVVATFPTTVPSGEVLRRIQEVLREKGAEA